jgi:exodeoxyribonuclease III
MRIATWNVNSLRIRQAILRQFVEAVQPDVLCLQETKVQDADFPHDLVRELGFAHVAFAGQKSYNGVAILSRHPLSQIEAMDVLGNGEKRHISAKLLNGLIVHNFYVPAGGDIPDPAVNLKFRDKLAFVDAMRDWAPKKLDDKDPIIALGDLNIAPLEHDVWSHKQLLDVVSHTPIEVEKFTAAQKSIGWVDAARRFVPENEKLYSWWSYRNRDWAKSNRGRRLDHLWLTPALAKRLEACSTLRDTRGWEGTSDHVPVYVDVAL